MLELVKEQEFSTVSEQIDCQITLQIHQIWCEHLGVSIANLDADFFTELGGSSLLIVLVVDEIAQKLHQKIDTHTLFQYRTIRKLAHFLKIEQEEQPLPCIHWISSEPKKDLPNFFFIETGHYYSYQTILKKPISSDYFNLAYLRIDQFKVLQGFHADSILEELVDLLKPFPNPVLLATSFNGFVAAKLNQQIGGALILIDSPWYEKEKIGSFNLQNRLIAMYHRFRSLSIRRAFIQASAQAIGYSLKKINLKKEDINPFEKSIQLFISQSRPVEKISHLLYFYSTKSVITSSKDVKHWSKVTGETYLYVDIVGDHLDALSESNSDLVLQKINEFLLRVYY
jgi:acyl carrier protein